MKSGSIAAAVGIALSREMSGMLIAGPTPFIASALVAASGGTPKYVAIYLMICCAITVFAVLMIHRKSINTGHD